MLQRRNNLQQFQVIFNVLVGDFSCGDRNNFVISRKSAFKV